MAVDYDVLKYRGGSHLMSVGPSRSGLTLVIVLLVAAVGQGQQPPDLLLPATATAEENQMLSQLAKEPGAVRSRLMALNRDLLRKIAADPNAAGQQMRVNFF